MEKQETDKLRRIRSFQIRKGHASYRQLDDLCDKSRRIYNSALYVLRNLYFASHPDKHDADYYIDRLPEAFKPHVVRKDKTVTCKKDGVTRTFSTYSVRYKSQGDANRSFGGDMALFSVFEHSNDEAYGRIQATAARAAVKLAVQNFKSFEKLLSDHLKKGGGEKGKPSPPRYRGGDKDRVPFVVDTFRQTRKGHVVINGQVELSNVYVDKKLGKVKQVRVIPEPTKDYFKVELVYERPKTAHVAGTGVMAIDIGINNLCAITTDGGDALLVNGRAAKNINQYYNKTVAQLNAEYQFLGVKTGKKRRMLERRRDNKLTTFMHQASRYIIDFARANGIGHILIGHDNGWKQKINFGKRVNQNFVQIPYAKLIGQLQYKGEDAGIHVEVISEEFTSLCSAFDNEKICKHEKYLGKRGGRHNKRFVTAEKKLVNADINGSLNILRLGTHKDIGAFPHALFAPPKFNKVGVERHNMQPQIRRGFHQGDMSCGDGPTRSRIKVEAAVDGHCGASSPHKECLILT